MICSFNFDCPPAPSSTGTQTLRPYRNMHPERRIIAKLFIYNIAMMILTYGTCEHKTIPYSDNQIEVLLFN